MTHTDWRKDLAAILRDTEHYNIKHVLVYALMERYGFQPEVQMFVLGMKQEEFVDILLYLNCGGFLDLDGPAYEYAREHEALFP